MHLLFEIGILLGHLLFFLRHLLADLVRIRVFRAAEVLAHAVLKILLVRGELLGFLGQITQLGARLFLAHALQRLLGLAQAFSRALGLSLGLLGTLLPGLP